ncbi:hypothetical protein E4U44_006007 [Claviceps purpurea]|nr:hypothetical protein E4U44_006007 [Claviceps purpurea]
MAFHNHNLACDNITTATMQTPHPDNDTRNTKHWHIGPSNSVDAQVTAKTLSFSSILRSTMSEDGNGFLYAELLANIRQVSVVAALPTPPKQDETRVNITNDGQRLFLDDCTGFTTAILLPAPVAASHDVVKNCRRRVSLPDLAAASIARCSFTSYFSREL